MIGSKKGIGSALFCVSSFDSSVDFANSQGRRSIWDSGDTSPQYLD